MKLKLSAKEEQLHHHAVEVCRVYFDSEWNVIRVLQEVERAKLYIKFELTSLHKYAMKFLNLSGPTAYLLIGVARKCNEVPELGVALKEQTLTAPKAARIVSTLTKENSAELISFAQKNDTRAIDFEVARRNPRAAARESAKPISGDFVEIKVAVPKSTFEKLERAQSVLAQKQGKRPNMATALDALLNDYLKKNDPVQKAERAVKKQQLCKTELKINGVEQARKYVVNSPAPAAQTPTRRPLKADQKHQVFARDGGRCTYKDCNGNRCENDKWLHIHHIRPVSQGGSNEPDNLTTLCWVHHDLVHQLSFPIEGQVTWLREPVRPYG